METIYEVVRIKQIIKEAAYIGKSDPITSPKIAAETAMHFIGDEDREVFLVMCLNRQKEIIGVHRAHIGTIDSNILSPRDIFKSAILSNSSSIIVSHNHPSGNIKVSHEDIETTKTLIEAGNIIGIPLIDHIVVTPQGEYTSLKLKGYFNEF